MWQRGYAMQEGGGAAGTRNGGDEKGYTCGETKGAAMAPTSATFLPSAALAMCMLSPVGLGRGGRGRVGSWAQQGWCFLRRAAPASRMRACPDPLVQSISSHQAPPRLLTRALLSSARQVQAQPDALHSVRSRLLHTAQVRGWAEAARVQACWMPARWRHAPGLLQPSFARAAPAGAARAPPSAPTRGGPPPLGAARGRAARGRAAGGARAARRRAPDRCQAHAAAAARPGGRQGWGLVG